jgi:hypothetical protein
MSTYKPDLMDIDEARDEMETCLTEAAWQERKGNTERADKFLRLALDAELSFRRIKSEYLYNLHNEV